MNYTSKREARKERTADWGTVEVTENLFRPIDEVVDCGNLRIRAKWILDLDKCAIRIVVIYYYYDLIEN